MTLQLTENQSRLAGIATVALVGILLLVWMLQQIAATSAYRKAMLAIAQAAKKDGTVTLQVVNFATPSPAEHGKPDTD